MKGPKRKKAPERKRLQAGNSGLVAKQSHRHGNGGVYHSPGINGEKTSDVLGEEYSRTPLRVLPRAFEKWDMTLDLTTSRVNQVARKAENTSYQQSES